MNLNLIILAGVPGSGKSTFAQKFFEEPYAFNHRIVSSDKIREGIFGSLEKSYEGNVKENNALVFSTFHDKISTDLADEWNVVADATFLTRRSRNTVSEIGVKAGAKVHLMLFKNVTQAEQRNSQREAATFVPDEAMSRMFNNYYNTLAEVAQETYETVTKIESFT